MDGRVLARDAPAEIESAKVRVEAAYRRLGYNEATVRTRGELEAVTGTMKVDLEVAEGQREVLAEVAIQGGSPQAQARTRRVDPHLGGAPRRA